MKRVLCAFVALAWLAALPGCSEIDHIFPWMWHVPKRIKEYDRLPGKSDIEEKKIEEKKREQERKDREAAALRKQRPAAPPPKADDLGPSAPKKK